MRLTSKILGGAALISMAASPHAFADTDASAIRPVQGLVITNTEHSTLVVAQSTGVHGYNNLDQENWTSIQTITPQDITYQVRLSAPTNQQANADARKFTLQRTVRRADIEQSTRMTILYSSTDPIMYAGQTFAETSTKTLTLLKSGADVPFVLGINGAIGGVLGAVAQAGGAVAAGQSGGALGNVGAAMSMLSSGRTYYRGALHRVESGPVTVSVLVNGVRTSLPAIHASGTFTFGSQPPFHGEFWWLDNPAYPLTLKWVLGPVDSLVTRIDLPLESSDEAPGSGSGKAGNSASAATSGIAKLSAQLDKACHAEVSGIYFNTGSAQILDESKPTLTAVAKLITQSKFAVLTIEGHTDNIGTAQYNQDLSDRRAEAVRKSLVADFAVPAGRLTAKGYGLTRPVETNTTPEGRAHNRRVELSRPCGAKS
jgi:outer membrane protein OmpA-like peptidoglycan-associated protein